MGQIPEATTEAASRREKGKGKREKRVRDQPSPLGEFQPLTR